ncbi:dihydroneopterin triphosphate diphosphatase [Alteromonas sp. a30]|uniref:dihydroneopterin triphosphate diphosphatase n=1 Tax=Alteromonas sp. a30 TaxID=2730917 RepID=UPI00228289FC|nr:dihydroneopterin triphosphate diphosphatase [Alteromonas sp. a30]MCY7295148.1 dihydroneopterin triphosphate diphosphatase [Alteromonas sp. a30]
MQLKRPESVLVVIFDERNRVLALQRKDDPNFWQSVTGSLETDEKPIETAKREVAEEIGIDCEQHALQMVFTDIVNHYPIRPEWRYRYPKDSILNKEFVFLLQIHSSFSIQLTEHLKYQWLSPQDAIDLMWSPSNKSAIKQFLLTPSTADGSELVEAG